MIATSHVNHLLHFYAPWSISLAAATAIEPVAGTPGLTVQFDSLTIPVLQAVLAAAGVLMGRPIALKKERRGGIGRFVLVTAIMMIVAILWVSDSHQPPVKVFVVAIGLGFSGYSLLELFGREIEGLVKGLFANIKGALGGRINKDVGTDE